MIPKNLMEFQWGHPQRGHRKEVGSKKSAICEQHLGNGTEQEQYSYFYLICDLSNNTVFGDLESSSRSFTYCKAFSNVIFRPFLQRLRRFQLI